MPMVRRRRRKSHRPNWVARITLGLLVAAAAGEAIYYFTRPGPPGRWQVSGRELAIADLSGRTLWRHDFPVPFQSNLYTQAASPRLFWFGDADGDGKIETLANYVPEHAESGEAALFCLSSDGQAKWAFRPGHRVEDQNTEYPQTFTTANFRFIPGQTGRQPLIAVVSNHVSGHPSQVALLDGRGTILAEYWHSGHLTEIMSADLSGDSKDDLLLAGVDAGRKRGALIWIDLDDMGGASTEEPGDPRQLKGFAPGTEKSVAYFPAAPLNGITVVGAEIRVSAPPLTYVFDKKLNFVVVEGAGVKAEEIRSQVSVVRGGR